MAKKRRIIIMAASKLAATADAARKMGVGPEQLEITLIGKGQYACELRSRTGISIDISDDEMEAAIVSIPPRLATTGRPPGRDDVREALKDAGVVFGIDEAAVKALGERAKAGGGVHDRVVVAKGKPPRRVLGGGVELLVAHLKRVVKGTTLARREAFADENAGVTVTGEKLPPIVEDATKVIDFTDHVEKADRGVRLVADISGTVLLEEGRCRVVPLVDVSADGQEARLSILPPASGDRVITLPEVEEFLAEQAVSFGLDMELVKQTVGEVESTLQPRLGVVVARGVPPVDGVDGRLEYFIDITEKVGLELDDGSIDFRERNTIRNVKAGESLVTRHPPQPGKPGRSVAGAHLPARDGQDAPLRPGENVELLEDGHTLRAKIDGCVVLKENALSVQDLYEVHGDVDYTTGNLDCNGILRVYGNVRSSFAARARSQIEVLGSVEDARVESGADIRISGGILMKGREEAGGAAGLGGGTTATRKLQKRESEVEADEVAAKGLVTARGSVYAAFATNAMVNADEDIWIKNEAMNCNLSANGKVAAIEGKGAIIGGRVRATQGVEARQLGSEAGIRTDVIIDVDPALRRQLKGIDEDFAKNNEEIEKINKMVKAGLLKDSGDMSPKKKEAVVKLLKYYKGLKQAQEDLAGRKVTIEELVGKSKRAKVTVYGTIFPGVFLKIHDKQYKVDKEAKDYQFHWSETDDQIVRTPVLKGPGERKVS